LLQEACSAGWLSCHLEGPASGSSTLPVERGWKTAAAEHIFYSLLR